MRAELKRNPDEVPAPRPNLESLSLNPPAAHILERTLTIAAGRDTVFAYFTDGLRFAAWWGAGSSIDAHAGGAVRIRYPNGATASGEVLEI